MIRVSIDGMSCQNCVRHVKEALSGLEGVTEVEVSLADNLATVQTAGELSDRLIRDTLDEEGYDVTAIARA
ncbi:heavy-metal-associated domain-containing protein [Candidatus Latescibacterota bacterium]